MKNYFHILLKGVCITAPFLLCQPMLANDAQLPVDTGIHPPPMVIACVGDSITAIGKGKPRSNGYPTQLDNMLGGQWKVENYGLSSTTLMTHVNPSYQNAPIFQDALASKADVVVIMLGTNDAKAKNWEQKSHFIKDYKALIGKFKAMENKPRIFIMKSPYICPSNRLNMSDAAVQEQCVMLDQIAKEENVGLLDAHTPTAGQDNLFGDGVHPNPIGSGIIAKTVYEALTGKIYSGPIPNISR